MSKIRILLIIGGMVATIWSVGFCGQPLTNEQLIIAAVKQAVQENIVADPSLVIQCQSRDGGIEKLIGDGIVEGASGKFGKLLYTSSPDSSNPSLQYYISGFEFTYKKGKSRGFLKSNRIARDLRCQLRISFSNQTSGILNSQDISVNYHDEIEPTDLNYVKSRNIQELAPPDPGSRWSKYAEPFLVVASVGTLVYLFFSNR